MDQNNHIKPTSALVKILGAVVLCSVALLVVFRLGLEMYGVWHDEWSGYNASTFVSDGICNIGVLPIVGDISTYGSSFDAYGNLMTSTNMSDTLYLLKAMEADPNVIGILVQVDSRGGTPAASEFIATELKRSHLPVAAFVLDAATSGGYLVATGADAIIASQFADIGSIAVTMSYLQETKRNEMEGYELVSLASAKFKDSGTSYRALTEEERALFERDLKINHELFIKLVALNRDIPEETVRVLADGSSMPAPLALEQNLIDQIGDRGSVREWFAQELNLSPEDIIFCE